VPRSYDAPMIDPIAKVVQSLATAKRVLITTHVRPDGDALGSTAAVHLGMRERGIESDVMLLSKLPTKYSFIYLDNDVKHFVAEAPTAEMFAKYDALLVVDTGTWSQLPGLEPIVPSWPGRKIVVDHHRTQGAWADTLWQDVNASAAGEMVERLLNRWDVPLTREIAACLFIAIVSDTGWLQYSNTTPRTLRLVADLVERGVDTDAIYQRLYQNERVERMLLQQRGMASMRIDGNGDGGIASMIVRAKDFSETNANVPDTEALVNLPLQVANVAVSCVFTEPPEGGTIRVSFRSKGKLDVSKFAEQFGGGGHARAAGAKIAGDVDEVRERVVAALVAALA
jgi:bifunctional oligoribonuclease and PAP phosphatase NrnA